MPFRFPGHWFDAAIGLHYNRFRYYDPVLGRYLQPDPLGTAGGRNLYAYSANPLKEVDVRGDCPTDGTATEKPATTEGGDPAAGPSLISGGGRTNHHAQRIAELLKSGRTGVRQNRSVQVIEHDDGTVSVGLSGKDPERQADAERVVDALNRQERAAGRGRTYRTSDGPVETSDLNTGMSGGVPPGQCSEAQAARAAGQHAPNSPPRNHQTVWSDPGGCPERHRMPGDPTTGVGDAPVQQMCPCRTCRGNADNYERTAGGDGAPSPTDTTTPHELPAMDPADHSGAYDPGDDE
jgi:RHS repeat-associated protein